MKHSDHDILTRQFDIAWKLTTLHLEGVTTEECLWRPAAEGLHVTQTSSGLWQADWPEHERYELGPSSIAWLTWHLGFWWSMVINHSFGDASLSREELHWPGDAESTRLWIYDLSRQWTAQLSKLTIGDLQADKLTRWPYTNRPFVDVIAWANIELMKNAAEIGYARYLFAVSSK